MSGALCEMPDFPASPCRHRHVRTAALRCPAAKRRKNIHVQPGHGVNCGWTNYQVSKPRTDERKSRQREKDPWCQRPRSRGSCETWGFSLAQSVASLHATRYAGPAHPRTTPTRGCLTRRGFDERESMLMVSSSIPPLKVRLLRFVHHHGPRCSPDPYC
jgi:hypothetical protein